MSTPASSLRLFAAGIALSAGLAAQFEPVPPPTPPRYTPGSATLLASPGMVTVVATGQVFTWYNGCGGEPISNAVAFALRMAQPGDVIGVYGIHPGITFVAYRDPCKQNEVSWPEGGVVHDVDIVGLGPAAAIDGVFVNGDYTASGQGGVDRITFQDLKLRNPSGSFAPFQTNNTGRQGLIRIYDCVFDAIDPSGWGGKGKKFDVRAYLFTPDIRGCISEHGAQEHNFYLDSPGSDEAYSFGGVIVNNTTLAPTGRTGLQIVNRIHPAGGSYVGAPGKGTVFVRGNTFWTDASAGGGAAITIAGHHGEVWVENNDVTADDFGGVGGSSDSGGFTAWFPGGPSETWPLGSGQANKQIYVIGNTFTGTGTRPNVAAAGCQSVWIGSNTFQMPGHGVEFDSPEGESPVLNGSEFLPASNIAGWQQGGCKARDLIGGTMQCLTDQQIDTLY